MFFIYSRVSTEEQDTQTQIDLCRKLVEQRPHHKIKYFTDEDSSTSYIPMQDRIGLQEMISQLRKGVTVVIYALDRLGRDIIEGVTIYRQIANAGAFLISVDNPLGETDFSMNIKFAVAQEEKRMISERTRFGLKQKQSRFERVGAVWFGYQLDETKLQTSKEKAPSFGKPYMLIPHPEEMKIVVQAIKLREEGLSYDKIADKLNEDGHFNRNGKPFQTMTVYRILSNRDNRYPAHMLQQAGLSLQSI